MVKVSTAEARTHFARYISLVEHQHEEIVIEKRGKKVAVIKPFTEAGIKESASPGISLAVLDALPSRSDRFVGIVKEADLDYRDSRSEYLLAKYS